MQGEMLLKYGHLAMILSLGVSIVCALIAYLIYEKFSFGLQLAAHLAFLVLPGLFKMGYLMRLVALKQLGKPVN